MLYELVLSSYNKNEIELELIDCMPSCHNDGQKALTVTTVKREEKTIDFRRRHFDLLTVKSSNVPSIFLLMLVFWPSPPLTLLVGYFALVQFVQDRTSNDAYVT